MTMFPSPGDEIYYNEAGEPTGWSKPAEPEYCGICGGHHPEGACLDDGDDDL